MNDYDERVENIVAHTFESKLKNATRCSSIEIFGQCSATDCSLLQVRLSDSTAQRLRWTESLFYRRNRCGVLEDTF